MKKRADSEEKLNRTLTGIRWNMVTSSNVAQIKRINIERFCSRAQDTAKIVLSTVNPAEFFDALNYLLDCLLYLMQYERYKIFKSPTPTEYYDSIIAELDTTVDNFINRSLKREKIILEGIDGDKEKFKHYESFLIALISAFDCAHTFWQGDNMVPHYTGALFSKANYARVQALYDGLDELSEPFIRAEIEKLKAEKGKPTSKLTYVDKERIMVRRMKAEDMLQFSSIDYDLKCPLYKYDKSGSHPFAYMNLNSKNIKIAKRDLKWLNSCIDSYRKKIPLLEKEFFINVQRIAFREYSDSYGYTRLICEPYTFNGNISRLPLQLLFMTRLNEESYYASGKIYYGDDGKIKKADVHIGFRNNPCEAATSWLFYFKTLDNTLILEQAKTSLCLDEKGLPLAVYRDASLIKYEREKEKDYQSFLWIQSNLPTICPKTFTGFRRMKTANSANYRKLLEEARKLGRNL